jgi:hypothetical protein
MVYPRSMTCISLKNTLDGLQFKSKTQNLLFKKECYDVLFDSTLRNREKKKAFTCGSALIIKKIIEISSLKK